MWVLNDLTPHPIAPVLNKDGGCVCGVPSAVTCFVNWLTLCITADVTLVRLSFSHSPLPLRYFYYPLLGAATHPDPRVGTTPPSGQKNHGFSIKGTKCDICHFSLAVNHLSASWRPSADVTRKKCYTALLLCILFKLVPTLFYLEFGFSVTLGYSSCHPSILFHLSLSGSRGAVAYPSYHRARGGDR